MYYTEKYLLGLPNMSECEMKIAFSSNKMVLRYRDSKTWKTLDVAIYAHEIIDFSIDGQTHRSGGRAVTGAIIGGILTGGIGLLVGGALGGRRQTENKLTVKLVWKDNRTYDVVFKPSKTANKLYQALVDFVANNPIVEELEVIEEKTIEEKTIEDVSDNLIGQLSKLAELHEKGFLTREEFDIQKQKLLS